MSEADATDDAKRQAYQERTEAQLREWNAKIEELKAKAERARAEGKIEYYEQIENLKAQRDVARQKLEALREASGEAWEDVRTSLERAAGELKQGLEAALSRLRGEEGDGGDAGGPGVPRQGDPAR